MQRHSRNAFFPFTCAFAANLLLQACGGATPHTTPQRTLTPRDLYPSGAGYVWSYNVDTGTGLNSLGVTRVASTEGEHFRIQTAESELPYEYRVDGIFRSDADAYLIRFPLEIGQSWPTSEGREARIVSISEAAHVPAGDFSGCVLVEESGGESGREIRTTYCPDVGPVIVEARQALRLRPEGMTVRGVLLGFVRGSEDDM